MDKEQILQPKPTTALSALDWIAAGLVFLESLALFLAPWTTTLNFKAMFADFTGNCTACLPLLTRLVMHPVYPLTCGLAVLGLGLWGLLGRGRVMQRRLLLVAAFFFGLVVLAVYVAGLWAPIIQLAGAVSA